MSSLPPDSEAKLRLALRTRTVTDIAGGDCLDDETVAGLAEGSLDPGLRAAAVSHLAACGSCRRALASVAGALGDAAVAREAAKVDGPHRHHRWYWVSASAVAAAAVLLLMVRPVPEPTPARAGSHRAPTIANGSIPDLTAPVGLVAAANELRWAGVAGADRYRVTLYDSSGRVIYEAEPADTAVALPDSLPLRPGSRYLWKVDARIGINRWTSSKLVEFSIAGGPER